MKLFKKKELLVNSWSPSDNKCKYPKWTFVRIKDTNQYYLLLEKSKMEFISERAFRSWGRPYVLATKESISGYTNWRKIGFAVGSMIESMADGTLWFLSGKDLLAPERRQISTPDFFNVLGFDMNDVYVVSLPEIDFHVRGEDIIGISL